MFWIHGGGYDGGTANNRYYWGDRLAEFGDVVVVTINYRLNVFGFFADPALRDEDPDNSTGNYGSLDQVAALKWVNDNIEAFGGDPDNITVFGESAGGYSICTLLATPLAKGLFQKAIMESGGCGSRGSLEDSYEHAAAFAKEMGCAPSDLDCLRGLTSKKIMSKISGGLGGGSGFRPHVDGYFLTAAPIDLIRSGDYNQVPFLAGFNRDEFAFMTAVLEPKLYRTRPSRYRKAIEEELGFSGDDARRLVELYPLSEFDNKPGKAFGRMRGVDGGIACATYTGLAEAAGRQSETYLYMFEFDDYYFSSLVGSVHSMEIPLIFDSMDRFPISIIYNKRKIRNARPLSRTMQGYWVNFAKTGDPNGEGLPEWPTYDPENMKTQVLDIEVRTRTFPYEDRCAFWDEYYKE
jgi:para-nitrobenzyl esterase